MLRFLVRGTKNYKLRSNVLLREGPPRIPVVKFLSPKRWISASPSCFVGSTRRFSSDGKTTAAGDEKEGSEDPIIPKEEIDDEEPSPEVIESIRRDVRRAFENGDFPPSRLERSNISITNVIRRFHQNADDILSGSSRPAQGFWGPFMALLFFGGVLVGLLGYYLFKTHIGFRRCAFLTSSVLPLFIDYHTTKLRGVFKTAAQEAEDFDAFYERSASEIASVLRILGGFYMKVAQLSSTRADFLPKAWISMLRALEPEHHFRDPDHVRAVIEAELGATMEKIFVEFDWNPLGVGTIGQTYSATLFSGEEVAVKVQPPRLQEIFEGDISMMRILSILFEPSLLSVFEEIELQFVSEFDYRIEAMNLSRAYNSLKIFSNEIVVPKPYFD